MDKRSRRESHLLKEIKSSSALKGSVLPLISISIPILNEEENLPLLIKTLQALADNERQNYQFEFIFTDNASSDNSWEYLHKESEKETRIRAFRFSKNIGYQNSILFNYAQTRGQAVVQLDADLQDPPNLIHGFIREWENGAKIVTGIRLERKERYFLKKFRNFGYWFIDRVSEHHIRRDAGDFRLLDREIIDQLTAIKTPNPYLRGIISGMSYPEVLVPYARNRRIAGTSKFGIIDLVKLGITGVVNHSKLPFKVINFIGFTSIILSFIGAVYILIIKFVQPDLPRGFTSIYLLLVFGIGLNALMLSIIGSYIRKLYLMLNGEPTVSVREVI